MKQLGLILFVIQGLSAQTFSPCDVNHDGVVNIVDVQAITNEALGLSPCTADLNGDGKCDVVDFQRVITAALSGTCATLPGPTTLRQAAAGRAILMGTAASADELPWVPNPLNEPAYAATLGAQYSMLSPENALKWIPVHPAQNTYNFEPSDQLVAFAQAHTMQIRGHNLCWYTSNPDWLTNLAKTASATTMSRVLQNHITTVVTRYRGQIFAWDVVNEAVSDWATGIGTDLQDSLWYNQPGIGLSGTGYVEQAFRWAHAADPNALLFYNDYAIEAPGPKFQAVYNMVKDFVTRGVPIHGVGLQMHIDTTGYPSNAGLTQNIQRLTALGLQVHITEMDVRLPRDSGFAGANDA